MAPPEKSIGAIHNWHGQHVWEHYQILNGKANKISQDKFHDLRKEGLVINQPLYVEEDSTRKPTYSPV